MRPHDFLSMQKRFTFSGNTFHKVQLAMKTVLNTAIGKMNELKKQSEAVEKALFLMSMCCCWRSSAMVMFQRQAFPALQASSREKYLLTGRAS